MRSPSKAAMRIGAVGTAIALTTLLGTHLAGAGPSEDDVLRARLGFTPLSGPAQTCSDTAIRWAPDVAPSAQILMRRGDPATPGPNALANQTSVPAENDMIAFAGDDTRFLYTVSEGGTTGAVTRLDTATGQKTILSQLPAPGFRRLDPIKWHAPSGKFLIGEETTGGLVYQIDPDTGAAVKLPWLGAMGHEGIAFGRDGAIWEGDENHQGAIFKAVPNDQSDLTKGGTLSFMTDGVGLTPVVDPARAVAEAFAGGATLFDRPEDFDARNGRIYFTVTEPPDVAAQESATAGRAIRSGGVYSVNDGGTPHVVQLIAVNDPALTRAGGATSVQGLQYPDNIAFDARGNLYIHEDIPDNFNIDPVTGRFKTGTNAGKEPSTETKDVHTKQFRNQQDELWVAILNGDGTGLADGQLHKFADLANSRDAVPCENEWTGGFFVGETFYVNQQHADNPTWRVDLPSPACAAIAALVRATTDPFLRQALEAQSRAAGCFVGATTPTSTSTTTPTSTTTSTSTSTSTTSTTATPNPATTVPSPSTDPTCTAIRGLLQATTDPSARQALQGALQRYGCGTGAG